MTKSLTIHLENVLAAMANLAAIQTKLKTLCGFAAGLKQNRVAVSMAVELLHWRLPDGRAAAGAGAAAGGAEDLNAGGAGLQQTQEQRRALAPQARQQQVETRVCGHHDKQTEGGKMIFRQIYLRSQLLDVLKACHTA